MGRWEAGSRDEGGRPRVYISRLGCGHLKTRVRSLTEIGLAVDVAGACFDLIFWWCFVKYTVVRDVERMDGHRWLCQDVSMSARLELVVLKYVVR